MSKLNYFWRIILYKGAIEELDAEFVDIKDGAVIFMNKEGVEVIYASGTWEKVLRVTEKEK